MKGKVLAYAIATLVKYLPEEEIKSLIDDMLDKIEEKVKDNKSAMDFIAWVRRIIDVPDDFGGDED